MLWPSENEMYTSPTRSTAVMGKMFTNDPLAAD
jgi:hypothetical protein